MPCGRKAQTTFQPVRSTGLGSPSSALPLLGLGDHRAFEPPGQGAHDDQAGVDGALQLVYAGHV